MSLQATASQTAGPFFHLGLTPLANSEVAAPGVPGEHITIRGRVIDGNGQGLSDAMVEVWQADSQGRYAHPDDPRHKSVDPGFKGFGRLMTARDGSFSFNTIKPGRAPGCTEKLQAPHIVVNIFARGLLKQLLTRIYFPDEASNADDELLHLVPADRRSTLICARVPDAGNVFEWNIVIQGEAETVFFDF